MPENGHSAENSPHSTLLRKSLTIQCMSSRRMAAVRKSSLAASKVSSCIAAVARTAARAVTAHQETRELAEMHVTKAQSDLQEALLEWNETLLQEIRDELFASDEPS